MKYSNPKWFTLIELIISVVIISMWFFWIIAAVKSWINFMEKTRKEVIAINMARSWMEIVYNIRDTNRNRRTSEVDKCWLKIDPMIDDSSSAWCDNDDWFTTGNYIPIMSQISWQKYFLLSWISSEMDLKDDIYTSDSNYTMCLSWWLWQNCPWVVATWDSIKEWRFFRQINWLWLQDKDTTGLLNCTKWDDTGCWTESAKEFRFCSKVNYLYGWWNVWKVEFCGILTNFYKY
jgi:type II secretory pathway pseudopilin PulG